MKFESILFILAFLCLGLISLPHSKKPPAQGESKAETLLPATPESVAGTEEASQIDGQSRSQDR